MEYTLPTIADKKINYQIILTLITSYNINHNTINSKHNNNIFKKTWKVTLYYHCLLAD